PGGSTGCPAGPRFPQWGGDSFSSSTSAGGAPIKSRRQREWRADAGERGGDPQRLRHDRRGRGRHGLQVGPLRRRAAP
ncbi:unnamed protein product, partial [Prorocentrum cordatum]